MRLVLRLIALAALAIALTGCTIVSRTRLLTAAEIVAPLPDRLQLTAYDPDTLKLSPGDTDALVRDGDSYFSDKGYRLRFAGEPDPQGRYLVEITGTKDNDEEGYMYGFARYADNLLGIEMVLPEDIDTVLASHPELGLKAGNDGLEVTTRKQLDALIALARSGELKLLGFVYFASNSAGTDAPAELERDEGWYKSKR